MSHDLLQISLSAARQCAALGKYDEALRLLDSITTVSSQPDIDEMELRARILAPCGEYANAISYWQQVLQTDASNESAKAGIRRSKIFQARPFASFMVTGRYLNLLVLLALGGIAYVLFQQNLIHKTVLADRPPIERPAGGPALEIQTVITSSPVEETIANPAREQSGLPNLALDSPDILLEPYGDDAIRLRFRQGLFYKGANLLPDASASLTQLGTQLRNIDDNLVIQVTGYTDDIPFTNKSSYTDNASLGLYRALHVAEFLRSVSELPLERFLILSRGEKDPPYPNDSHDNRRKNRTVEIILYKARQ